MKFASESLATAQGIDVGNLEFWVVLTNVAIVVATLMLTRVTAKDAMLHEEKIVDKTTDTTHDLTDILHEVLVRDGLVREDPTHKETEEKPPLQAVK